MSFSLFPTTKLLLVAYALFTFGCQIERCPEEEPELEFYRYDYQSADPNNTTSTDTLTLIFQFADCQGDVGIPAGEDTKNLQTELFYKSQGEWVRFVAPDTTLSDILYAQVPEAKKLKKNQRVEGIIKQPINSPRSFGVDTIRFETVLFDVVGNSSQRITTPEYVLN